MKIIKVLCTNIAGDSNPKRKLNNIYTLTIGSIYDAIDTNSIEYAPYRTQYQVRTDAQDYCIVDNTGFDRCFPKSWFITIAELRNRQIDEILN